MPCAAGSARRGADGGDAARFRRLWIIRRFDHRSAVSGVDTTDDAISDADAIAHAITDAIPDPISHAIAAAETSAQNAGAEL